MLKTIIQYVIFHCQEGAHIYKNCSHFILYQQLLRGLVCMTKYVCTVYNYFYRVFTFSLYF
jgi:hypothetical protein